MISITAIPTGTVTLKRTLAASKPGKGGILSVLRDKTYVSLPIFCFLLKHPDEGNILIDTGDTYLNSLPGYVSWWNRPFYETLAQVKVGRYEEIGDGLLKVGLDPAKDIDTIILTHLHRDHAGGLYHFPHTKRMLVSKQNWQDAKQLMASVSGYLPNRFPYWFDPDLIECNGPSVGPFDNSYSVTSDGRITLVPTPGHCPGHLSVIVRNDDESTYFLAGDAIYTEEYFRQGMITGLTSQPEVAEDSCRRIREFCTQAPVVLLPSHDPHTIQRLQDKQTYKG